MRLGAAVVVGLLLALVLTTATSTARHTGHPTPPLQSGDVVLRHGNSLWSSVFAQLNSRDRRFSHAGVVIGDGFRWYVIHAEADNLGRYGQVRMDEWEIFSRDAQRLAILRLNDVSAADRTADAALSMYHHTLPFDFSFDLTRLDAVYCSELVWRALMEALQHDPLPEKAVVHGRNAVLVENLLLDVPGLSVVYASGS